MAEAAQAPTRRTSSVAYALGRLETLVASQGDALKALPSEFMAVLAPKMLMVEDHERRLRVVEHRYWMVLGGGSLMVPFIVWLVQETINHGH